MWDTSCIHNLCSRLLWWLQFFPIKHLIKIRSHLNRIKCSKFQQLSISFWLIQIVQKHEKSNRLLRTPQTGHNWFLLGKLNQFCIIHRKSIANESVASATLCLCGHCTSRFEEMQKELQGFYHLFLFFLDCSCRMFRYEAISFISMIFARFSSVGGRMTGTSPSRSRGYCQFAKYRSLYETMS